MEQPQNIGEYKIARQLGVGLMGPVYLGTREGQYWALRVLADSCVRTTKAATKLIGDVQHDALVRYREIANDASVGTFLSTDYIEAMPITRDGMAGFPSRERLNFIIDLLSGIQFLHSKSLVHGCIKASNILLRKRANKINGLMIDAGLVYVTQAHAKERMLTKVYPSMAPELIKAYDSGDRNTIDEALTPAADVYATGMLIAEVFSGRKMFGDARSVANLLETKKNTTIEVVGINTSESQINTQQLNSVIKSATQYDANSRIKSMSEMVDKLLSCLPSSDAS